MFGREILWLPLNAAPPSSSPVVAVAVMVVLLLLLLVESVALKLDPFGKCQTPFVVAVPDPRLVLLVRCR